jgi:argininosuccinate synthase
MSKTAVLAYSGGLDTTCIIAWLKEFYDYDEVVAVLCDVGQEFDLEQSQERGYAAGADDVLLVDRREAFANDQVAKAIQTNALYEGKYPLVSALSRPVIAQAVAELALDLVPRRPSTAAPARETISSGSSSRFVRTTRACA